MGSTVPAAYDPRVDQSRGAAPFAVSDAELVERTSAKWRAFPNGTWPAWIAEMDVTLAESVKAALASAVEHSDTGYQFSEDVPRALCEYLQRSQGLVLDTERVFVLGDVLSGIAQSLAVLCPPDPGVIITPPIYPPFFSTVTDVARGRVVEVPLLRDEMGWSYDLDGMAAAMARADVHALLLSHPHNPTGIVADTDVMNALLALAARHGVLVISDEIHAPLVHPQTPFTSFLGVDHHGADVVVPLSASKAWNIPGLKCAQLVAGSAQLAERLESGIPMEVRYGAGHFGVLGTLAAYDHGGQWLDSVTQQLAVNTALTAELMAEHLPFAAYAPAPASYLAWLELAAYGHEDPAAVVQEASNLATNSGLPFGSGGVGCLRLNIGTAPHRLPTFITAIAKALG
jgi:cysteine-S-conjugate beta-lyase